MITASTTHIKKLEKYPAAEYLNLLAHQNPQAIGTVTNPTPHNPPRKIIITCLAIHDGTACIKYCRPEE